MSARVVDLIPHKRRDPWSVHLYTASSYTSATAGDTSQNISWGSFDLHDSRASVKPPEAEIGKDLLCNFHLSNWEVNRHRLLASLSVRNPREDIEIIRTLTARQETMSSEETGLRCPVG